MSTNKVKLCGRCYERVDELFPANCNEKPEKLLGEPIGMYHCPECGAMVIAGLEHPMLCKRCLERNHPGFDPPENCSNCGCRFHSDACELKMKLKNCSVIKV